MTTIEMRVAADYEVKRQHAECTGFSLKWCTNTRTTNGKHVWFWIFVRYHQQPRQRYKVTNYFFQQVKTLISTS